MFNTVSQIGNSVGLTLGAVIAASVTGASHQELGEGEGDQDRLLKGFRATFWMCFTSIFVVVGVSLTGLRMAGKVGLKKE